MSPVTKISRVLVGVDFDDASASALKMAGVLASAWDAEITVVHAAALELPAYFTGAQIVALQAEREKSRGNCHPAAPIGRSARPAHRSRGGGGRPTTRRDSANGAFIRSDCGRNTQEIRSAATVAWLGSGGGRTPLTASGTRRSRRRGRARHTSYPDDSRGRM
jgi:hypothetical protein